MLTDAPTTDLRQGDLSSVPIFPRWDLGTAMTFSGGGASGPGAIQMRDWDKVLAAPGGGRLVAICSYDCDIENPRSRSGIIIAPVMKPPASPADARYERIRNSHTPIGREYSFLQFFPMALPEGAGSEWGVVDFSASISMGSAQAASEQLLERKSAELTDEYRSRFRSKLAVFVGRPDLPPPVK